MRKLCTDNNDKQLGNNNNNKQRDIPLIYAQNRVTPNTHAVYHVCTQQFRCKQSLCAHSLIFHDTSRFIFVAL